MPSRVEDHPQHLRRILTRNSNLMGTLNAEYRKSRPESGEDGFRNEVFELIKVFLEALPNPGFVETHYATREKLDNFFAQKDPSRIESDTSFIRYSCLYAVAALWALDHRDQDMAWELMCQAEFFLGATMLTNRGEEIFTKTVVSLHKAGVGAHGAARTNLVHDHWKELAFATVRASAPWPSVAKAAKAAKEALKAKKINSYNDETIEDWLKAMLDIEQLVPSYAARRDKQQSRPMASNKT